MYHEFGIGDFPIGCYKHDGPNGLFICYKFLWLHDSNMSENYQLSPQRSTCFKIEAHALQISLQPLHNCTTVYWVGSGNSLWRSTTWKKGQSEHRLQRYSERGLFWQYFTYIWKFSLWRAEWRIFMWNCTVDWKLKADARSGPREDCTYPFKEAESYSRRHCNAVLKIIEENSDEDSNC